MNGDRFPVFVRVDDVTDLTRGLRAVVSTLLEAGIPANYALIPKDLTSGAAEYMRQRRRDNPGMIELNQHGYCHQQVIRGKLYWSEFAGGRPYAEQAADIAEGRNILQTMLAEDFGASVFVPPSHKYDENTLLAVETLGFEVLSAACYSSVSAQLYYAFGRRLRAVNLVGRRVSYHCRRIPRRAIVEISVAIDVDMEQRWNGAYRIKDLPLLTREFERSRRRQPVVGIMLHQEMYTDERRLRTLKTFLEHLQGNSSIQFRTIESIRRDLELLRSRNVVLSR